MSTYCIKRKNGYTIIFASRCMYQPYPQLLAKCHCASFSALFSPLHSVTVSQTNNSTRNTSSFVTKNMEIFVMSEEIEETIHARWLAPTNQHQCKMIDKSMLCMHAPQYAKRHLSGLHDVKIKPIAIVVVVG